MSITSNAGINITGNVGINTPFSSSYALDVSGDGNFTGTIYAETFSIDKFAINTLDVSGNGNFTGSVIATSFNATSDYRIKENVKLLDEKFVVDSLIPVTYNNKVTKKQDIGLIAHELQEHYPFLVNGEKDTEEYQSVNYTGLIPILIKEIQELKKEVKTLKEIIKNKIEY
jgi:hypothetical protein